MKYVMLFEQYIKYSDYDEPRNRRYKAFGGTERMMSDVKSFLRFNVLPDEKFVKSIEDVSVPDKGIKFEVKLTNGDTIHLYRTYLTNNIWEVYHNKKKIDAAKLKKQLEDDLMSPVDIFLKYAPSFDYAADYIDDGGQWRRAKANNSAIISMWDKLSSSDKKKAVKLLKKKVKHDHKSIDNQFKA